MPEGDIVRDRCLSLLLPSSPANDPLLDPLMPPPPRPLLPLRPLKGMSRRVVAEEVAEDSLTGEGLLATAPLVPPTMSIASSVALSVER